jgi:hypothetical protein
VSGCKCFNSIFCLLSMAVLKLCLASLYAPMEACSGMSYYDCGLFLRALSQFCRFWAVQPQVKDGLATERMSNKTRGRRPASKALSLTTKDTPSSSFLRIRSSEAGLNRPRLFKILSLEVPECPPKEKM